MAAAQVHIVPHTHWDREWYSPFQTFRLRLVDLLDELLPALEADPGYAHFLLDGQMAVVDDYLAIRPEAEAALARLAASGRVAMGPWYALPDEFLVSGETLIRNLQRGLQAATRFGGAMEVGYLPDMFGHVAQMPQLLRQFGFEHTVVWRGVPRAMDRTGFWWRSPDGSEVRAEYLPQGYGNGARVPEDAKALLRRIDEFTDEQGERLVGAVLWMNGTDHLPPQPWLGRVVAEANALQDDVELRICSLAEHLAAAPTDDLPVWDGELRSGARANLLMGVTSNRTDVRVAAARAERALEQLAEPLNAMLRPADAWPGALLDEAWLEMIRNSAHDSICACSHDEVVDAVLHRFAEATQIGEGLTARAIGALGAATAGEGPIVVNPSAHARSGIVQVDLAQEEVPAGAQLLRRRPAERTMLVADAAIATITVAELEYVPRITSFWLERVDSREVLIRVERQEDGTLVTPSIRAELAELRQRYAGEELRVQITTPPGVRVLARATDVPGYGWQPALSEAEPTGTEAFVDVTDTALHMANGVTSIEVDPRHGTFAVDGVSGYGKLVDGGDVGDTYNWCPPPIETLVDAPSSVEVRMLEAGPLRGRLQICSRYELPTHVEGDERTGRIDLDVTTTLELLAGEELVRVTVELDNHGVRDHRMRVHLPLPQPTATSTAECAFATVDRGLTAEGGPTEVGLPTFPSRRFVRAGGLTVLHEGLPEYELVDIDDGRARTLAITLVRSTGMLSQGPMATRPLPAGPLDRLEGAQLQKPLTLRYALHVGDRDPYELVDETFLPLLVTEAAGGDGPRTGQALEVSGAVVSSVTRIGESVQVRLFNPRDNSTVVRLPGQTGWLIDLRGRPITSFEGEFDLGPWQLATAALAPTPNPRS